MGSWKSSVSSAGSSGAIQTGSQSLGRCPRPRRVRLSWQPQGSSVGTARAGCDDHENPQRPKSRRLSRLRMHRTTAASARVTNTAVGLTRGGRRAGQGLGARRALVTSRSRHATISRRAANPSPLTLNPLHRHTSWLSVKEETLASRDGHEICRRRARWIWCREQLAWCRQKHTAGEHG